MKRVILPVFGSMLTFLISGCAGFFDTPGHWEKLPFSAFNKGVTWFNSKPYYVPKGTRFMIANGSLIQGVKSVQILPDCEAGDLIWFETDLNEKLTSSRNMKDWSAMEKTMIYGANNNLIGCTKPLSDAEYNFYLNKENQQGRQNNNSNSNVADAINHQTQQQSLENVVNNIAEDNRVRSIQNQMMLNNAPTYNYKYNNGKLTY